MKEMKREGSDALTRKLHTLLLYKRSCILPAAHHNNCFINGIYLFKKIYF